MEKVAKRKQEEPREEIKKYKLENTIAQRSQQISEQEQNNRTQINNIYYRNNNHTT